MWKYLLATPLIFGLVACGSSGDGAGGSNSTTYSISGTLDAGNTATSLSVGRKGWDLESMAFNLKARTACDDGQFYSVFCMTFTSPPVAAEGDVSCSGTSGSFTVDGLPIGEPIFCVVRRYPDATSTSGTNVGAIEIPTANLSGSSDTIVGNGNLQMAVTMGANGTITASVTGEQGSSNNTTVDNFFSPANANGTWTLACDNNNGGTQFSAGACKCFLGESEYGAAGYSNQDDCLNDAGGPGAAITNPVSMDIDMFIHPVTTTGVVNTDGGDIPSGTSLKAISIWASGAKGAGGEGVTNLGGLLNWDLADTTNAIAWTTGAVNVQDGADATISVTIPALPAAANSMTHGQWITWAQTVAANAETGGYACTWGPGDANAHSANAGTNLDMNIECVNQVLDSLSDDGVNATVPRIRIQPYCDQNGCMISTDATGDSGQPYLNASSFSVARIEFENWDLSYPSNWQSSDDNTNITNSNNDGIGVGPKSRFVFEPLVIHPNGAGFRQNHHGERHYQCLTAGGEVNNAACSSGTSYYELVCYYTEQLAIKFIGTASPMDVIFDNLQSPVSARLIEHNGMGANEIPPTGTNVIDMCETALGVSGFTFFASGTKN